METLRIIVVDDDRLIGPLLGEVLSGMGHVVCAIEATEAGAVAAAGRLRPDLIIMDVELGGGSGVRAMREIARAGSVPHVFISGAGLSAKLPAAVLRKPFSEAELLRAMQRALGAGTALAHAEPRQDRTAPRDP